MNFSSFGQLCNDIDIDLAQESSVSLAVSLIDLIQPVDAAERKNIEVIFFECLISDCFSCANLEVRTHKIEIVLSKLKRERKGYFKRPVEEALWPAHRTPRNLDCGQGLSARIRLGQTTAQDKAIEIVKLASKMIEKSGNTMRPARATKKPKV